MATITYTVTVQSTGSGNKYFIDGVQQPTLYFEVGNTYKFDQSDSSNGTGGQHPLRFSTNPNNSPAAQYTTGVTSSGTPGTSGAYVQIVVSASTTTSLYYYCTNHSGMGGAANVTTLAQVSSAGLAAYGSSTWGSQSWGGNNQPNVTVGTGTLAFPEQGWGGKAWGQNLWGELSDNTIVVSGNSLTLAIGTEDAEGVINTGWGRSTWGSAVWNGFGTVIPTQASASFTLDSVTITAEINSGWGGRAWGEDGWGIAGTVLVSGNQASISSASGQDAWGADTWSAYNTRWGGQGTVDVAINQEINVTALTPLSASVEDVTEKVAVEVFLSQNPLSTLSTSVGQADPAPDSMPSGVQLATSLGTVQAFNQQGWGRDRWGQEVWGAEGDWVYVDVTGFGLTVDSGLRESWGQDTWGASTTEWGGVSITDVDISINADVSRSFTPGWGAAIGWGAQAWGQATVDIGMTANEGTVDPAPDAFVTGIASTTDTGSIIVGGDALASPSTNLLSISLGNEDAVPNTQVDLTGIELTSVMGVPTAGLSVLVDCTGVTSSFSTGIIGLNAWKLVDPGTIPTWKLVA